MIHVNTTVEKVAELEHFCHLSKPGTTITVIPWCNGEGFTVELDKQFMGLTYGQWQALQVLANYPDVKK